MIHANNKIKFLGKTYIKPSTDKAENKSDIIEFANKISVTSGFNEFCDTVDGYIANHPDATVINENFIKDGEYYIQLGLTDDINQMKNVLKYLNKNNFSISPDEIIDASNNNGFSILITKFKSSDSKNITNYDKKSEYIPTASKNKAYSDLAKLTEFGFVNMNIIENKDALKYIKPTQRIICEDWSYIIPVKDYLINSDNESRGDLLKRLYSTIY